MPYFKARATGSKTSSFFLSTALISGLIAFPGYAQDSTFDGNTDTDYSNAVNWDNGVPAAGDRATFDDAGAAVTGNLGGATQTIGSVTVTAIGSIEDGTFAFDNSGAAGELAYDDADSTALASTLTLDMNGGDLNIVSTTAIDIAGDITNTGAIAALNLSTTGAAMAVDGDLNNATVTFGDGANTSVFTVNIGSVTGMGATTIADDATLVLGSAASSGLLTAGAVITGTLDVNGMDTTLDLATLTGTGIVTSNSADAEITVNGPGAFGVLIEDGTTGVVSSTFDAGGAVNTISLTRGQTNTGLTTVRNGTLSLDTGNAIVNTGNVTVDLGGTLLLNTGAERIGSIAGAGNVDLGANELILGGDETTTFAGVISGAGALRVHSAGGAGSLELTDQNTYTGLTTVQRGILVLNNAGENALDDAAAVLINSVGTLDVRTNETIGTLAGNGDLTLTAGTLTIDTDVTGGSFTGDVTGAGGLALAIGAGNEFTLDSNGNTYAGPTVVTSGTLIAQGGNAIGDASAVTVTDTLDLAADETIGTLEGSGIVGLDSHSLTVAGAVDTTFGGTLTGLAASELNKTTSGTLTLGGDNSGFAGTINISGTGTIAGAADNAFGTGEITLDNGTLNVTATATLTNDIAVTAAGGSIVTSANQELTLDGDLTNAGALNFGSGTTSTFVIDSANVTNTGSTTIANRATVVLGSANSRNLMNNGVSLTGTVDMNGQDTAFTNVTGTGSITSNNGDATATINGAGVFGARIEDGTGSTVSSTFDAGGAVNTISLTRGQTNTGLTTVRNGTLSLDTGNAIVNTGNVTVDLGGTLLLNTGAERIGSIAGAGNVDLGANELILGGDETTTFAGVISGAGALRVHSAGGAGSLELTDQNTYTGLTTVQRGILVLNNAGENALDDAAAVLINSVGTLDVRTNETIGTLAGNGDLTLTAGTLTIDTDVTGGSFTGDVTGAGGLALAIGAGNEFTLDSNGNTYAGPTVVTSGTLIAQGGNAIGDASAVTVTANGTLDIRANETIGSLVGAGPTGSVIIDNGDVLTIGGDETTTFAGVISGAGGLTVDSAGGAGELTLTGDNTFTGAAVVNSGTLILTGNNSAMTGGMAITGPGVVDGNSDNAFGTGLITIDAGTMNVSATTTVSNTISVAAAGGTISTQPGIDANLTGNIGTAGALVFSGGGDATFAGMVSGAGSLSNTAAGTLTLTGDNSGLTGGLNVSGMGVVRGSDDGVLNTLGTGPITLDDGTLTVTATSTITNAISVAAGGGSLGADAGVDVTVTGNISTIGELTVTSNDMTTIDGVISGVGGLTLDSGDGTGELTLTNVNTYTGTTTVESGTLVLANANTLADNSAVVVNDTLNLGTSDETIGSLAGTGTVNLDGNTLTIAQSGTLAVPVVTEFSGVIAGAGNPLPGPDVIALVINSTTDTLILSGANTYTGLTDVQSGGLRIGAGGSILGDVNTAGTFANEGTIGGLLTVTAGMARNEGAGALTDVDITGGTFETGIATVGVTPATSDVSGTATITGGTMNVSGGTVNLASNTGGALNINGGTVTTVNSSATTTVGAGGSVGTATVTGGTFTTAGSVTGSLNNNGGAVSVTGGSVASLNNAAGSAAITGGNVATMINSATATNSGTVGSLSQSTGSFSNSGSVASASISGGSFNTTGTVGTLTNAGGSSTVQAGTVTSASNTAGTLNITGGSVGSLSSSATTTNAGTVGNAAISGGTFANSGTVTGGTTITAGSVTNSGGLGDVTLTGGSITNVSGNVGGIGNTGGAVIINGGNAQAVVNNIGELTIANGGEVGVVTNSGTASNAGTVGTLENQAGTFENTGTISGATTLVDGTITNTGNMGSLSATGGNFIGSAGLVGDVTNNGGNLEFTGGSVGAIENNTGTVLLGTTGGAVSNAATLNLTGSASSLTNTGGIASVSGSVSGLTTVSGGQVTNTGGLNGGVNVLAGNLVSTNTIQGTLNASGGTVTLSGRLNGVLEAGNGDVTITGNLTDVARIANTGSGGLLIAAGTTTLDNGGTVSNAGAMTVNGNLVGINGALSNSGNLDIGSSGSVAMNITNTGTLDADGAVLGNIVNAANGTVNLTGTQNGTFTNQGVAVISGTNDGGITNNAELTVAEGGEVKGDITNNETLDLIGDVTGNVINASRMRFAGGDVTGTVTNNGVTSLLEGNSTVGFFVNETDFVAETGTMTYGTFTNNGTATVQGMGILSGGTYTNNSALTVQDGGQISAGLVINNAELMLNDAGRIGANVVNNARLNAFGKTQAGGDLTNTSTGVINMAGNQSINDVIEVSGNATLNGVINMDINLDPLTPGADRIEVKNGAVSGDVVFNFGNLSEEFGTLDGGLTVLSYGSLDPAFAFDQTGLPANGALVYGFIDDTDAKSLIINAGANPAVAGIASGLTLTQSLINTVVNRPSSPFVAGLAAEDDDPCGFGSWARGVGGTADVTGETSTSIGNFNSEISASYGGLQVGFDYSCFDSRYAGFDLSFGGIVGANIGSLSQPVFAFDPGTASLDRNAITSINDTDFSQTYAGAYIGASRGRLFGDVQLRFDSTSFELTNTLAEGIIAGGGNDIGVSDQEYDSTSTTISGSVGYAFPLSEKSGLVFVPAVGVSHSRTSVDALSFDGGTPGDTSDDRVLEIDDIVSTVAFASATLSRSKVLPSGTAALNIFGTATYYHDFGKDTTSRFYQLDANGIREGDPLTTTSSNLGAYAELSLGVNYTKLIQPGAFGGARQFDASVRIDGRFSGGLDSVGITGQMRFQF